MSSLGRNGDHWVEGGMTYFTSVIAVTPRLRDYLSSRHITSKFHFPSQGKPGSRRLDCLHIHFAGIFMLRKAQHILGIKTSVILMLRRMHAAMNRSVSVQLATEISNFGHEKVSYK